MPTIPELGYTDYEAVSWNNVEAPAKTPKDTLAQLVNWFHTAGESDEMKQKLGVLGLAPHVVCGAEHQADLRRQYEQYDKAIRDAHIQVQ